MNLKYRLIYADTGIPCSDWSDDAEHFLRYLANRPDFVPKIIVMVEESNLVGVLNANGKWMLVPKEEAYKYNGNDDEGLAVFGLPPDATADDINKLLDPLVPYYDGGREFLIPKSEADDLERFDEFEAAADTADKLEQINAAKPNNERDDLFIEKTCPFGHSPRDTTFGGDALHHSCGSAVLKGEKLV
jgi:hypothetical protein